MTALEDMVQLSGRRPRGQNSKPQWRSSFLSRTSAIPELGSRVVRRPGGDIAVFRNADGQCFALLDRCPHKGGSLSQGIVFGKSVACPLHGWTIGLEDGCAVAPDVGCTRSFPVKLDDGEVFLRLLD